MKLIIDKQEYAISLTEEGQEFFDSQGEIVGVMRRYGDELYFLVNLEYSYEAKEDKFAIGDLIYWKSEKSWKEAIAVFFGNTPIGDGDAPRAPGSALRLGQISLSDEEVRVAKDKLETGSLGRILYYK